MRRGSQKLLKHVSRSLPSSVKSLRRESVLKSIDPVKDADRYDELFREIVLLQGELEKIRVTLRDVHDGQEA